MIVALTWRTDGVKGVFTFLGLFSDDDLIIILIDIEYN